MAEFSVRRSTKKRGVYSKVIKDVLPLAEQPIRFTIGIGEILEFHSAVFEKVDVEKISINVAAYRIAEDVRYYRQLAGLNKNMTKTINRSACLKKCDCCK